jgi:putative ABC transport system permease protein
VLEGDRGITFADAVPRGSTLTAGAWWPKDYKGPPLVSFDRDLAEGLGLGLGDDVTVNVLGRSVTARIANLRKIDWQSLGINFVMVFSANSFTGAPHMELASAAFPGKAAAAAESALSRDVSASYPTVTIVRVKDVIEAIDGLVGKLGIATRGASAVTIVASVLVLAGALAAGRRARIYDAVMLKVLGATRRRLLLAFVLEYAILGLGTALFAIVAGAAAADAVVEHVMHFDFRFALAPAFEAVVAALLITVGLGLIGTWRILGQSPAAYLREA